MSLLIDSLLMGLGNRNPEVVFEKTIMAENRGSVSTVPCKLSGVIISEKFGGIMFQR